MSKPTMFWGPHVYFLRPVGREGPVKIGWSSFPESRLRMYAQWSPVPLELAASTPGGERLERQFHHFFAAHHSHHEWFHGHPEITAAIDALRAGAFAFDTLPTTRKQLPWIIHPNARPSVLTALAEGSA